MLGRLRDPVIRDVRPDRRPLSASSIPEVGAVGALAVYRGARVSVRQSSCRNRRGESGPDGKLNHQLRSQIGLNARRIHVDFHAAAVLRRAGPEPSGVVTLDGRGARLALPANAADIDDVPTTSLNSR